MAEKFVKYFTKSGFCPFPRQDGQSPSAFFKAKAKHGQNYSRSVVPDILDPIGISLQERLRRQTINLILTKVFYEEKEKSLNLTNIGE